MIHVNPSPATYLATSAIGAISPLLAATPAAAAYAPLVHAAAEAAPWWGPMVLSTTAMVGGPIALWFLKSIFGGALEVAAASLRQWARNVLNKAKSTPDKSDDGPASVQAAAIEAAARQLEEVAKNNPLDKE